MLTRASDGERERERQFMGMWLYTWSRNHVPLSCASPDAADDDDAFLWCSNDNDDDATPIVSLPGRGSSLKASVSELDPGVSRSCGRVLPPAAAASCHVAGSKSVVIVAIDDVIVRTMAKKCTSTKGFLHRCHIFCTTRNVILPNAVSRWFYYASSSASWDGGGGSRHSSLKSNYVPYFGLAMSFSGGAAIQSGHSILYPRGRRRRWWWCGSHNNCVHFSKFL